MFLVDLSKEFKFFGLKFLSFLIPALAALFLLAGNAFSQESVVPAQTSLRLTSEQFVSQDGLTVEKLIESGGSRRADLLAARQR